MLPLPVFVALLAAMPGAFVALIAGGIHLSRRRGVWSMEGETVRIPRHAAPLAIERRPR